MVLDGGLSALYIPPIPEDFSRKLTWSGYCQLTQREQSLFTSAFCAFFEAYNANPPREPEITTNIIISDRDTISISYNNPDDLGTTIRFIIYPVHRWRARRLNDLQIMTCILEELCHMFFTIDDEFQVQDAVVACLKYLLPNVSKSVVYNLNWMPDDLG